MRKGGFEILFSSSLLHVSTVIIDTVISDIRDRVSVTALSQQGADSGELRTLEGVEKVIFVTKLNGAVVLLNQHVREVESAHEVFVDNSFLFQQLADLPEVCITGNLIT